jgi:ribosome-associated toxin RatA of RatAB toxin-antitoxin module
MQQIQRSALVGFSAQQMFQLVNDVHAYPEFLPGCVGSQILSRDEHTMTAAVSVAKGGIRNQFTTANRLKPSHGIEIELVDGPFKALKGNWRFDALDDFACKVTLDLQFEFHNRVVAMAFGKIFNDLVGSMVQAFSERAKRVYNHV